MNLVAKEYVAAQDPEDPGVLVLSEFAGAAEQMHGGASRQPARHRRRWPTPSTARCTCRSTSVASAGAALDAAVREQDIAWWRRGFLDALDATRGATPARAQRRRRMSLDDLDDLRLGRGDALFLDFDGTLAELGPDPDAIVAAAGDRRGASSGSPSGSAGRSR